MADLGTGVTAGQSLVCPLPRKDANVRLVCFGAAGSAASQFFPLASLLPPHIELLAAQLPGRQQRVQEFPYVRMGPAVDEMEQAFLSLDDMNYAILGICTGSLMAFELARRLHLQKPGLLGMFVASSRAPHMPDRDEPIHGLDEESMWQELERLGGTPPDVLANASLRESLSGTLRADFEMAETYTYTPTEPLTCPIVAMSGNRDRAVSVEELRGWSLATREATELIILPGDHYLLGSATQAIARTVRSFMDDWTVQCSRK